MSTARQFSAMTSVLLSEELHSTSRQSSDSFYVYFSNIYRQHHFLNNIIHVVPTGNSIITQYIQMKAEKNNT